MPLARSPRTSCAPSWKLPLALKIVVPGTNPRSRRICVPEIAILGQEGAPTAILGQEAAAMAERGAAAAGERPGEFPYTRGISTEARPWIMGQYAGFGTPRESNRRFQQ